MHIFKRILNFIETRSCQPRVNWLRTIYFNFKVLNINEAIKIPIYIYGHVKFWGVNGKVQFKNTPIVRGMVKIGENVDSFSIPNKSGYIAINEQAQIIFEGKAKIGVNCVIRVNGDGLLHFHKYVFLGSGVRIFCNGGKITIGKYTRIAYETVFMNSGYHYIYDLKKNTVNRRTKPINIGDFNWIGNRTTLSGGCVTKDYTVITSGSIVNKDFSKADDKYLMLSGIPAKPILSGVKRIFSPKLDEQITHYFETNPDSEIFRPRESLKDDICELEDEF
jgi:acetyltransferase-like isoleucine patch superfamily enzyme